MCVHVEHTYVYDLKQHTRHAQMCAREHTHIYIHLRHTHKCVELENKHVLLGKLAHMCTPGTHICVHLQHANVFTWSTDVFTCVQFRHTCVYTWSTCVHLEHKHVQLKHTCVYTWDTHMYTTGTQICVPLEHLVSTWNTACAIKAHMCVHVEHICAHRSKHKCSPKAHTHTLTCAHLEDNHAFLEHIHVSPAEQIT